MAGDDRKRSGGQGWWPEDEPPEPEPKSKPKEGEGEGPSRPPRGLASPDRPRSSGRYSWFVGLAFVALTMSVRYPVPVRTVATSVREHVASRVGELTGLEVVEVDITVPALVSRHPRPPRVR